jgi:hypothetical protein
MPDGNFKPPAPPLPATIADWDAARVNRNLPRSLNDIVEEIHRRLVVDDSETGRDYRKYLFAIWPSEAIEGAIVYDDAKAAMIIQQFAQDVGIEIPASSNKIDPIVKSLHVTLSRYEQSRKQRRDVVQGIPVTRRRGRPRRNQTDDNNNNE